MIAFRIFSAMLAVLKIVSLWIVAFSSSHGVGGQNLQHCFSGNNTSNSFEVLPGHGWDNLRNVETGRIYSMNFTECKVSPDRQYLLPNSVSLIPLKMSDVETFAELIEHWSEYVSSMSRSVNVDAGLHFVNFQISGKFSYDYQQVKQRQYESKSITTRVQLRYDRYIVNLDPTAILDHAFRCRILTIASHYQNNNTEIARYESDLLIRDYGTHVITRLHAGASLLQVDQVSSTYASSYDMHRSSILASASASFFGVINFDASYGSSVSESTKKAYLANRTHSHVQAHGGPMFKANFSVNDWVNGLDNGLVAIDRAGDPLHFVIEPDRFPELPDITVRKVAGVVRDAIQRYYKYNTYHGCTSPDSPNFSFQANVDDNSCKAPSTNFTFGGVFQTCRNNPGSSAGDVCAPKIQKNPLTGAFSCPLNYQSVELTSGTITKGFSRYECQRKCHSCWLVATCCHNDCGNVYYSSAGTYNAYWCAATTPVKQDSGFLFGGLYTSRVGNPLTNTQSCPEHFLPLHLGQDLTVCVSDDYELGFRFSMPFSGFFSCSAGNPLALPSSSATKSNTKLLQFVVNSGPSAWPHRCPSGYSQHLAVVDQGCEVEYCVKTNAFKHVASTPIRRPPFTPEPMEPDTLTNTLYIRGPSGKLWVKEQDHWIRVDNIDAESYKELQGDILQGSSDDKGISPGAAAGVSVAVTTICLLIGAAVFMTYRRKRSREYKELESVSHDRSTNGQCSSVQYGATAENHPQSDI